MTDHNLLETIHLDIKNIIIPALKRAHNQGVDILTALADLNAAVGELTDDVNQVVTLVKGLQSSGSVDAATAESIVASLTQLHTKLQALVPLVAPAAPGA